MIRAMEKENIQFLCEQNGETECEFKSAIFSFFHEKITQVRAYLARVSYKNEKNKFNVALCFRSESNHQFLLENSTRIFKNIFGVNEHLDIIFIDKFEEKKLREVSCPFYTSEGYQITSPDFYLTSSEGYDLKTVRKCYKKKKLIGENLDGYMLCDITPPLFGQKFGLGEVNISQLVLASRHKDHSLFPIKEWPAYVHVARPVVDNIEDIFFINKSDIELIGWGEIYKDKNDIT